MAFTPNFHSNTPPHHFDTIAKHLLRSRQIGDTSKCDIRLILRNGQHELVHSCVIMGHSGTLAGILNNCRPPYAPIDLTSFDELAVRRVIDWMYCGHINMPRSGLRAILAVASHLRVSELQRDLENHLKYLAMNDDLIFAINTATSDSFSVSDETIASLTATMSQRINNIFDVDIASLSFNTIVAIMTTLLPSEQKVPLVNMAIRWLKLKNADIAARETVTRSIAMSDQDSENLFGIRTGLIIQLSKNNFDVRLMSNRNGDVIIRSRPASYGEGRILEPNRRRSRARQTRSQLSVLNDQPDPFSSNFEIPQQPTQTWQNLPPRRGLSMSSMSDQNVYNNNQPSTRRSNSDYSTFGSLSSRSMTRRQPTDSQIGDLHTLPDVFEGSPYRRQLDNPVEQSQSLQSLLAAIPDPFSPRAPRCSNYRPVARRSLFDPAELAAIPDPFLRADIARHNVDHEHLNQIPNPFESRPTRSPIRRQNSDHSRLAQLPDPFVTQPTRSPLRRQNSEHSRLAALPDPFVSRDVGCRLRRQNSDHSRLAEIADPFVSHPTRSPLRRTNSDHSRIAELPDPFVKTRGELYRQHVDHEHLNEIADPFRLRKNNSDPTNLNSIADPFTESNGKKVLLKPTSSGFPKAFTKSEVDVLRGMDDPFSKTEKSSSIRSLRSSSQNKPFTLNQTGFNKPGCRKTFSLNRPKSLDESELEHLRTIPDPFQPVVMNPISHVKSPAPSTSAMAAPLKSPRFAAPSTPRTAQENSEKNNKKTLIRSQYLYPQ